MRLRRVTPFSIGVLAVLLGLCLAQFASAPVAHATDCQYFSETQYRVCGNFLTYWQTHGDLAQQGYPISNAFDEQNQPPPAGDGKSHRVQYFQRARFEEHLENQPPYNVLLGLLGSEQLAQKYPNVTPPAAPSAGDTCQTFVETGYSACGTILAYWLMHGGLAQQGFPISNAFDEQNLPPPAGDGKIHRVQYFQRARFEEHLENQVPYLTLLGLLGSEQFGQKYPGGTTPFSPDQLISSFTPANNGKTGGTMIYAFGGQSFDPVKTLNPYYNTSSSGLTVINLVYESLIKLTPNGTYYPDLLTEVPTLQNGDVRANNNGTMDMTLKLKPNLLWSDGVPLTANDIAYTIAWINNPGHTNIQVDPTTYSTITNVATPNATTAVLHFSKLYGPYLDLISLAPLPQHIFSHIPIDANLANNPEMLQPTVVSGPFKAVQVVPDQKVVLVRNDTYTPVWGRNAYLDGVIFQVIGNTSGAGTGLLRGEIDVVEYFQEQDVDQLRSKQGIVIDSEPSFDHEKLGLNMADPTLQDPAVRHALDLAIDRQALINATATNLNLPLATPVSPLSFAFDANRHPVVQNVADARKALDDDGWLTGDEGIRVKNGTRLRLTISSTSYNTRRDKIEKILQVYFKNIGVDLGIESFGAPLFFDSYAHHGVLATGGYQLSLFTDGGITDPDSLYNTYHSSQIPSDSNKFTGSNWGRVNDPAIDQALDAQRSQIDYGQRIASWKAFQAAYQKGEYEFPLYSRIWLTAYNVRIGNYKANSTRAGNEWNAVDWYIK